MVNQSKYKGKINTEGKQVYDAPIRIVDNNDLRNYGITWKDCETLYVGGIEPMNVYMYETDDPKLADSFWKEINVEHHRNCRSTRCIVPGKQKPLIVCQECNKCSNCPYGRKPEDRQPRVIDYLKFPRSFSLVSPIISKSHLEKNRIIDKMLRRL